MTLKNVDFNSTFSALIIGFFANNILPGRAGEFVRAYILGSKENIKKSFVLGTIVIERLFDIFTLLLFLLLSTFMFSLPQWAKHIGVSIFLLLLVTPLKGCAFFCIKSSLLSEQKSFSKLKCKKSVTGVKPTKKREKCKDFQN